MNNMILIFTIFTCLCTSQKKITFTDGDIFLLHRLVDYTAIDDIEQNAIDIFTEKTYAGNNYVCEIEACKKKRTSTALIKQLFTNASKLVDGAKYDEKNIKKQIKHFNSLYKTDLKYTDRQIYDVTKLNVYMRFDLKKTFVIYGKKYVKSYKSYDINQFYCKLNLFSESFSSFRKIKEVLIRFDSILLLLKDLHERLKNEPLFTSKFKGYFFYLENSPKTIENMQTMFCRFFEYTKLKNTEGLYKKLYEYEQVSSCTASCDRANPLDYYNDYRSKIEKLFALCNLYKQMFDGTLEKCTETCGYFENNVKNLTKVKKQFLYEINKIKLENTTELTKNRVFYDLLLNLNDVYWVCLLELHFLYKVTLESSFDRLSDCDAKREYYSSLIQKENKCIIKMCFTHKSKFFNTESFEKHLQNDLDKSRLEILIKSLLTKEKNMKNLGELFTNKHDNIFSNLKFRTYTCYIELLYFLDKTNQYNISASLYNNSTFASDLEECKKKLKKNILIFERSYDNNKDTPNDDGIQKIVDYANNFFNNLTHSTGPNNCYNFINLKSEIKSLNILVSKRMVNLLDLDFNVKEFLKYKINKKFKILYCAPELYDRIIIANQKFDDICTEMLFQSKKSCFDLMEKLIYDLNKVLAVFDAIDVKIEALKSSSPFVSLCNVYSRSQIEDRVFKLTENFIAVVDLNYKGVQEKCLHIYQSDIMPNIENLSKIINEIYSESLITKTFYAFLSSFENIKNQKQKSENFQKYINSPYHHIDIKVLTDIYLKSDSEHRKSSNNSYIYDSVEKIEEIRTILRYLLIFEPEPFIFQINTLISKYLEDVNKIESDYYHAFPRLITFFKSKKTTVNSKRETDAMRSQYNIDYGNMRFDEIESMLKYFLELSNKIIHLSDLDDKKLRDQYLYTHNFLLEITEGSDPMFAAGFYQISNRDTFKSGIYSVLDKNMKFIAENIRIDRTLCNLESFKTLTEKMESISSEINILYVLEHSPRGIKSSMMNEKSSLSAMNQLYEIYHNYNIHAYFGVYFSKCLFKKLPLKASEWNSTTCKILFDNFSEFNLTSTNFIEAFRFTPFEHSKLIIEIKHSVTKKIYDGFTRLLKIELKELNITCKGFDDDSVSCLKRIYLAYNTLAQRIIPIEKENCKNFINNCVEKIIRDKFGARVNTLYKEIKKFEQFSEVSVDVINLNLNTIVQGLVEFNFENNDFSKLYILTNEYYSQVKSISNILDRLYLAICRQLSNICRFESNKEYNKCINNIIELEYILKSVNFRTDRDLVSEIQVLWLMHLFSQFNLINKEIARNWNCRYGTPIGTYIQEGKEVLQKLCLMYHPDQPYYRRHLILSPVPRVIFYGYSDSILNCLIYLYSANLKTDKIKKSPFDVRMRQEIEIFLYKAKVGFFDDLFDATLTHFKQAAYLIELTKDLQIIMNDQTKPTKFVMYYIKNSILEMIRILTKNTDTFTFLLFFERIKCLEQLQSLFCYILAQNKKVSEEKHIRNIYAKKLDEWYKEVTDSFDHNLSVLLKKSYKNKVHISITGLRIQSKYTDTVYFLKHYIRDFDYSERKDFFLYSNRNPRNFKNTAKFVNNAIDYQKITLQEVCLKNQSFSQFKNAILNKNNNIIESLKNPISLISSNACEEIHHTLIVDTIYFIIENALMKQLIFIITDDIVKSNSQDELIKLEKNAFTIVNNIESSIKKWKVQIQIPKINEILEFLDSKIKMNIVSSIKRLTENIYSEKIGIKKGTNVCEVFIKNNISIIDKKLKVLNNIKEKILSFDLSPVKKLKRTKSNVRKNKQ